MTAAGGRRRAVAALRSILFLVGGFVMIEEEYRQRSPSRSAPATSGPRWTTRPSATVIRAAMTDSTDTDALFTYTLDRLLDAVLD